MKQEMKPERERVSEGKIQQDIKGAERFSSGREEKGKSEGAVELEVVGVLKVVVEEGREVLQITHCTLLNSAGPHTHIKAVPLYARGLVSPCPPPMSLHTSSCSC